MLTACSSNPKERIVTQTVIQAPDIPIKEWPRPIKLMDIRWYVVTKSSLEDFMKEYEKKTGDMVFFAMSVPDYEKMSLNVAELKRYIEQQNAVVVYYEEQITATKNIINKDTKENTQE